MINEALVLETLKKVRYPGFSRDIVSFGLVKAVRLDGAAVDIDLHLTTSDPRVPAQIEEESRQALAAVPGIGPIRFHTQVTTPVTAAMQAGGGVKSKIDGVRHVIAVASGKGGVGKSTVAANLAAAFAKQGFRTGLCDCDLYGPSMGVMFGIQEHPTATEDERINPIEAHGIRMMSMGFLLGEDSPAILRGPMVTRYTQQFLRHVAWGELDVLVLDLPPGTGDIQLTIVQTVALTGAVIVTTPQEVALIDARKAAAMFHKVSVPILGLIENMSYFLCPSDGIRYDIFGQGGGKREAARLQIPLLAEVPLDMATREAGDAGRPIVLARPDSPVSKAFVDAALALAPLLRGDGVAPKPA
jgi:ATP-binding protein involved in chromosome partitioning